MKCPRCGWVADNHGKFVCGVCGYKEGEKILATTDYLSVTKDVNPIAMIGYRKRKLRNQRH